MARNHSLSPVLVTGRKYYFGYFHHVLAHYVLKCACVKWPDLLSGLSFFLQRAEGSGDKSSTMLIHIEKLISAEQCLAEVGEGLQFGHGFHGGFGLVVLL